MQETNVQTLAWEDSLEKEMATHSSILAWRIGRLWGLKQSYKTEHTWAYPHQIDLIDILRHSTVPHLFAMKWKVRLVKAMVFPVVMLLNCGVGEDSWESLGLQGDPTSTSKRRSFLGVHRKNDAKAETPILWPPHEKRWLTGKDPNAGRDWGQEEKGMTEDEMAGWHHWVNGHEFV